MEGVGALGVDDVAESYWEVCVVCRQDQVALGHSAGLHVGFVVGWEEMVVAPLGGDHGSSDFFVVAAICQGGVEWIFVGCFLNPTFERAKCINCDFRDIHKQKYEVLHNKNFDVEKLSSNPLNLVQHAVSICWAGRS